MDHIAVEPKDRSQESAAQRHATAQDGVEDGLNVSRRAADDPQDFACCSLLFLCLPQLAGACLKLAQCLALTL
jgi:hypothetical protein